MSPGEAPQACNLDGASDHRTVSTEPKDHVNFDAGSIRLRGRALRLTGRLYPVAYFRLHRIGSPADTDLRVNSRSLLFHGDGITSNDYYRVDLKAVDGSEEGQVGWGSHQDVAPSFTAEDYINAIRLGNKVFKKWIVFVWYTKKDHIWAVSSQVEGKTYTVEDCLNILDEVPDHIRREVRGFGPRTWTVGQPIPRCYLAKDLPIRLIESKIREVMRR